MKIRLTCLGTLEEALLQAPLLDSLGASAHGPVSDQPFPKGASERRLRRDFAAPQSVLIVASEPDGERLAGLSYAGPVEDPTSLERAPCLLALWVEPRLRHQGLARELVKETRKILAGRGQHRLLARVAHNDDALISMGERWGFVRTWEWMVSE